MGISVGDLQATMNLIEMGLEDEEQVQKIFGKFMNAFVLAMKNKEISEAYTAMTRDATGFKVNLECFGELEKQIEQMNAKMDMMGSMMTRAIEISNEIHSRSVYMFLTLTEYIQAKDPELAKVVNDKLLEFSNNILQANQGQAEPEQTAPVN